VSLVMSRVDPYTFLKTGMAIRNRRPDVGLYMLSRSSIDQAGSILRELKVGPPAAQTIAAAIDPSAAPVRPRVDDGSTLRVPALLLCRARSAYRYA
jgi:hypothetical protein